MTGVPAAKSKDERIKLGAEVFSNNCQACHQENGEGVPDAFPPLAKSDYLNADKMRAIKTVTGGLEQKLVVNGKEFNGVMPAWDLSDEDIANVLTFVYSKWGNAGHEVTPEEVKAASRESRGQERGLRCRAERSGDRVRGAHCRRSMAPVAALAEAEIAPAGMVVVPAGHVHTLPA